MLTNTSFQITNVDSSSPLTKVLETLINVRQERELVTGGENLLHCDGSVCLLLFDIVTKLDIPDEEQRRLLGSELFDAATNFVTRQV